MKNDPENTKGSPEQSKTNDISSLTQERATASNAIEIPSISLPKGGGALKGIDEKFKVNSSNGTAGFRIPIPATPGRNGFSPSLSINYNSGAGNTPFGLGWSLNYPSIQRKTDRKIPRYLEGTDEDTFMFSGAEDLVPFLEENSNGNGFDEKIKSTPDGYSVKQYRPRIEGGFVRIEKIQHPSYGIYWKVTTRDNTTTIFGRSTLARISDPKDSSRIYQWMPEFSYDDKGNWIAYHYKKDTNLNEDGSPIMDDNIPNHIFEKNRKSGLAPFTNTYLKRIVYGNRKAYHADPLKPYDPQPPIEKEYFFEMVLDYGEHNLQNPTPQDTGIWNYRNDTFSSYRSGFEIRTNRLCKRILMFHHFKDEKQFADTPEATDFGENYLVRSLDLTHEPSSINDSGQTEVTYLKAFTQNGYIRKSDGSYAKKALPPIEFTYQKLHWNTTIKTVSEENIMNAPVGLTNNYQWVDLYGEGISGILTEQGEGWFYKSNLGNTADDNEVTFTSAQKVISKPSFSGLSQGILSLQDLEANGQKQVVAHSKGIQGYFELDEDKNWKPFRTFDQITNIDLQNPNIRFLDLDGDGQPELVMTDENVFTWYAADGKRGYLPAVHILKALEEEQGPTIVFADSEQTLFLADMCGDGLTDIVRIRNGEICYWANMGYGKFSAKITMDNVPLFDHQNQFNPQYLHLADVSGTGATDIIYLGENTFKAFINLSGNAWSEAHVIEPFTSMDNHSKLSVVDLLGTGTSCIVWSSDLPAYSNAPMRYIDLMNSKKPHVLIHYKNNLGKETTIEYKSSTHFYVKDKLEGTPWITKLPFPVQVISKMIVEEKITNVRFSSKYSYHHGYYDHTEREFRGFGRVEQLDTELYHSWSSNNQGNQLESASALYQPPVLTKTWYHTGAFFDRTKITTQYKQEYWLEEYDKAFPNAPISVIEPELEDARIVAAQNLTNTQIIDQLSAGEWQEALRACKGMVLRQEVFTLDGKENDENSMQKQAKPYSVATHNCHIQLLQPRNNNKYAVFMVTENEAISIHYERDETDPRVAHTLNTKIDELGQILEAAAVVYPRKQIQTELPVEIQEKQAQTHIIYTQNRFTNDVILPHAYRLRVTAATKTYEITGLTPSTSLYQIADFEDILASASTEIAYHENTTAGNIERRLIEDVQTLYQKDDLTASLPLGTIESKGFGYESYQLAYTPDLIQHIFGSKIIDMDGIMEEGRFLKQEEHWWIRSGTVQLLDPLNNETFIDAQNRFYTPLSYTDPFGSVTQISYYKNYFLMTDGTTDAVGNQTSVERFNFRTLSPTLMKDSNDNLSEVLLDELGLVKAIAIMGKGNEADDLQGLSEITSEAEHNLIQQYFTLSDTSALRDTARQLLQHATGRFVYNFHQYQTSVFLQEEQLEQNPDTLPCAIVKILPTVTGSIIREDHHQVNSNSRLLLSFEYADGMGNVAMVKSQAEPGEALHLNLQPNCGYTLEIVDTTTNNQLRWIGNGRTVLNNKGNPVKQYEPYFSVNPFYEDAKELVERGVTPIIYYDAAGRNTRTELPDGTFTKIEFDAWLQRSYDQNDTVLDSQWYIDQGNPDPNGSAPTDKNQLAAWKAAQHHNTPSVVHLDTLGRPVYSIAHNRVSGIDEFYETIIHLDIEGNARSVVDARGNTVMSYQYDLLGHRVYQNSMDAGERWILGNVAGNPLRSWDSRNHMTSSIYDALQRLLETRVQGGGGDTPLDHIFSKTIYGEGQTNDKANNLRGQVVTQYDTAGKTEVIQFDFKGNPLESSRRFAIDYKQVPNWEGTDLDTALETETFITTIAYDALNRVISSTTPDGSITIPGYNEAGLLETVQVQLASIGNTPPEVKTFVQKINYDEKGQRQNILYGNNVRTTYYYDPFTFRLIHLHSRKQSNELLQDLQYTYDPAGNITEIEDQAIPTIFFGNHQMEPKSQYTYDALYRLVEAKGREHIAQVDHGNEDNWSDLPFLKQYSTNDPMAWRTYTQSYQYDAVGNILQMNHNATGGSWTRSYQYETNNNRLMSTTVGDQTYTYPHDITHGYITQMPHLSLMQWNFKEELQATARQVINNGIPEITYYVYDGSGQRVRKITENEGGTTKKDERIYLGGIEIYRKHSGTNTGLERITLHIIDDSGRIAMVDTRNEVNDETDGRTLRYQLGNHLGSAALELNQTAEVISYEEYHPYGTTSYQAVNAAIKTAAKRYRYTGMERDEETGFSYHSARYYLPWLGRWLSSDPIGIGDGVNLYRYASNNPLIFIDLSGNNNEDWQQVETEDPNATYHQNINTGTVIRQAPGVREVWASESGVAGEYVAVYQEYHFADDHFILNPSPTESKSQPVEEPTSSTPKEEETSTLETAADIATDFIPIVGSGKDLYRGIRDGDAFGIAIGIGGLALDIVTLGSSSLVKGAVKTGVKQGAKQLAKEGVKKGLKKTVEKGSKELAEKGAKELAETGGKKALKEASPSKLGTLVGTSRSQMRRAAAKKIAEMTDHPLKFLLDSSGKFKRPPNRKHSTLFNRPEIIEMGHIVSNKAGGVEKVMLQAAWINQRNNVIAEGMKKGGKNLGVYIENIAIDIGGVAVGLETAKWWVKEGLLSKKVFENAYRLVF